MSRSTPEHTTDNALVSAFLQGDTRAFSHIVNRHRASLLYSAKCIVDGHPQDAEDIVQEALLKAAQKLDTYRCEASLGTWLKSLVKNTALDLVTSPTHNEWEHYQDHEGFEGYHPSIAYQPHERFHQKREMEEALALLSEEQRHALLGLDQEGFSVEELAQEANVQPGTIKSRRNRARRVIAQSLVEAGH